LIEGHRDAEPLHGDALNLMIKPAFLSSDEQPTTLGHVFEAPLVVKRISGLPVLELAAWGFLTWLAGHKKPAWPRSKRVAAGALTTMILFASEWGHNLAHAAIAHHIGKPVDAIRILGGTPLLIYYDTNDQEVSPRQHILRATGGPIFNACMVPLCWIARNLTREGSLPRYAANFALGTNIFIASVALLPIPGIDGGPILKWSLVEKGQSPQGADETVQKVNIAMGSGLTIATGVAIQKQHKWLAAAIGAFALTSLAIGVGLLKEQK
jgi:Zn-dependent protease